MTQRLVQCRSQIEFHLEILRRHEIRFHLTGGLTSTAYGEPRMTQDIDVVVDPKRIQRVLDAFIRSLGLAGLLTEVLAESDESPVGSIPQSRRLLQ